MIGKMNKQHHEIAANAIKATKTSIEDSLVSRDFFLSAIQDAAAAVTKNKPVTTAPRISHLSKIAFTRCWSSSAGNTTSTKPALGVPIFTRVNMRNEKSASDGSAVPITDNHNGELFLMRREYII